jgi:threonine dehydratase
MGIIANRSGPRCDIGSGRRKWVAFWSMSRGPRGKFAVKVYGCEPARALDARLSLQQGFVVKPDPADTIAEGLRTSLGELTFGILRDHVEEIFVVEEEEILAAMKLAFERLHIVLEPSSAVALAHFLRGESVLVNKRVGVILSGGNISLSDFFSLTGKIF